MAQGRHYVSRSVEENTASIGGESAAATLIPELPAFRLSTFGIGPWQASSPITMNDLPVTPPSPVSTRPPTPISAAIPQSHLSGFRMPGDGDKTKIFEMQSSEDVNTGKRHHFAVQQPVRGREGEDQDPLPGRPGARAGRMRRLIGWLKTAVSRVRRWGR